MSQPTININLTGLEHKWGKHNVCAVCGKDHDDVATDEEDDEADGNGGALQMFRGEGDACQMLVLCWHPCAAGRMQNPKNN
jgi:hypothetical protein